MEMNNHEKTLVKIVYNLLTVFPEYLRYYCYAVNDVLSNFSSRKQ